MEKTMQNKNKPPTTPSWEERFEYMERNHGWIPEHKERVKSFLKEEREKAYERGQQVERQFILNILDGIDIADEETGNTGGGTRAIRHALKSRYIGQEDGKNNIK